MQFKIRWFHKRIILCAQLFCAFNYSTYSQSIAPGDLSEERRRMESVLQEDSLAPSLMIRPLINLDSAKSMIRLMPVSSVLQFNSHHPYGWNDGSLIPSKGFQQRVSAGVYLKYKNFSVQVQPEIVYAFNPSFLQYSPLQSDRNWKLYYDNVLNIIDAPQRFGNNRYFKILPGQSHLRYNYKKLSFGLSTENLWWGPGERNSLIMSNNAPGFEHITFNTTSPVNTRIGTFEGQLISGILRNSEVLPPESSRMYNDTILYIPRGNINRYINGMVLTWQPRWIKGLYVGFSRVFYQYSNNIPNTLNGYLPVFGAFFKGNSVNEDDFGRDQMLSLFFKWRFYRDKAEIYFEYGRNDHNQNPNDLIQEPEHARAYTFGLKKIFNKKNEEKIEFFTEFTHLTIPSTSQVRLIPTWYTHFQVREGYTNRGQVMGAGIGPGSSSQTIGLKFYKPQKQFGLFLERIAYNNDFYYAVYSAQRNFEAHWIDLSLNGNYLVQKKRISYRLDLSLIRSYNYQWNFDYLNPALEKMDRNVNNIYSKFTIAYKF